MARLFDGKCTQDACDRRDQSVEVWADDVQKDILMEKVDATLKQLQCEACRGPLVRILSMPRVHTSGSSMSNEQMIKAMNEIMPEGKAYKSQGFDGKTGKVTEGAMWVANDLHKGGNS